MMDLSARRLAIFPALLLCLTVPAPAENLPVRVVLMGDSYITSFGVDTKDTFGVGLEAALKADGLLVQVTDTGYVATAYRGREGLDRFLTSEIFLGGTGPRAVILELGSNDCGRYTLEETQASLDAVLAELANRQIPVLVVGTTAYDTCPIKDRPDYPARYVQMFADLAAKYGDLYYRDFKEGVSGHPDLMQSDRDHPNRDGDAVIVANMLPIVRELVARAQP